MERHEYHVMDALEQDFWWYRGLHAAVVCRLDRLGLPPGSRLLDAGCGTGGVLHQLAQQRPAWHYTGLEFDAEAARLARAKTGVPVVRGSVNALPFADQAFDTILSQDVLYHRNVDEAAMLAECFRCLRPGGHLLVQAAAFNWMRSAHDEHVHGARRYTASRLATLLTRAGFTVTRTEYWNSLLFPLMVLQRQLVGRHQTRSDVHPLPPWLNASLFQMLDLERRLGIQLPFGGSVWAWATRPGGPATPQDHHAP